jgi:cobalt-precorrin-5B (C1)-methyltransferase
MIRKPHGPLRRGWTTGACAAAATRAAYTALLSGAFPDPVEIALPNGERPSFALAKQELGRDRAAAGIVKDAGDDPDVTHGALVLARVRRLPGKRGVAFVAGEGVGTVTREGLGLAVGEAAINPVPRRMMEEAVADIARRFGASGDVEIEISIPGGKKMARRTMNGRLGIVGGLSILGTSGIVVPFSCSSWIYAIRRGIDIARAAGIEHVAGCTGSASEKAVMAFHGLSEQALIDMGDFAGGMLKYLRDCPLPRLTIAGGFAKIAKLAAGYLDLHSGRSQVDFEGLAEMAAELGADPALQSRIRSANTARQVLRLCIESRIPLGDAIARRARGVAVGLLSGETAVEVLIFDRDGVLVGRSDG